MKVYIAGPYSSDPEGNTNRAIDEAERWMAAGFEVFLPHLFHFWDKRYPHSYDDWTKAAMGWLMVCDALYRMPGESPGADLEVKMAHTICIPVFTSIEEGLRRREAGT